MNTTYHIYSIRFTVCGVEHSTTIKAFNKEDAKKQLRCAIMDTIRIEDPVMWVVDKSVPQVIPPQPRRRERK